jgi:hypothetical protein
MPKYLGTKQVSELFPWLTPGAIRNLVNRRKIPFRKPAGRLVFVYDELIEWVESAPGLSMEQLKKKSLSGQDVADISQYMNPDYRSTFEAKVIE